MIAALENHLWQSTLFAGVVWVLTLALQRNRAALRHGLWVAASVKFLVPFAALVTLGSQVGWRNAPLELTVVAQISEPFAVQAPAPAPAPALAPKVPTRIPGILFGLWLCGFMANCLAWWRRWRRLRAGSRMTLGIFGAFRPLLLLPEGIRQRLTPAQFEAVIEHELCHMRRRDNLTAAIHMLVEALFWFHPLVWWIEARLVEERERACDEEVLRMGHDPQAYAEGIVNVAKFYLEPPLACVAGVTGGNLTRRVEAIMLHRGTRTLGFGSRLMLAVAGISAVAGPVAVGAMNPPVRLFAQMPPAPGPPVVEAQQVQPEREPAPAPAPMKFQMRNASWKDAFETKTPSRQIQPWSRWKQTLVEKRDPSSGQRSFIADERFEYRWKPEWMGPGYACSVEIRPAGDEDQWYRLPEVDIMYQTSDHTYAAADAPVTRRRPQMHFFTTTGVAIAGRRGHANIDAGDCGRVIAVAAGRFSPEVAIPVVW
jgi:beta-lactamase regulating signal transducer with metallopeptidase domain